MREKRTPPPERDGAEKVAQFLAVLVIGERDRGAPLPVRAKITRDGKTTDCELLPDRTIRMRREL
jgi:hypothetical protein